MKRVVFILYTVVLLITSCGQSETVETPKKKFNAATSDFTYRDTIEGFKLIIKKGMIYRSDKRPNTLIVVGSPVSIAENKSICYLVEKGKQEYVVSPYKFLMDFPLAQKSTAEISNMKVFDYKNGFKMGEASIRTLPETGILQYGTIRLYVKDETFFQIMVLYYSFSQANKEKEQTNDILNSFEILE